MPGRAVFFARVSSASMPGRAFSDRLFPQGAASGHTGLTWLDLTRTTVAVAKVITTTNGGTLQV